MFMCCNLGLSVNDRDATLVKLQPFKVKSAKSCFFSSWLEGLCKEFTRELF